MQCSLFHRDIAAAIKQSTCTFEREREKESQTDRQADKQTDRQRDRQGERMREKVTERKKRRGVCDSIYPVLPRSSTKHQYNVYQPCFNTNSP